MGGEPDQIQRLDDQIAACDGEVAERMRPFEDELRRLDAIPGVGRRTAEVIIAEIGTDLSRFLTARHLAAWAGMCPGNKESGGKRRPAGTRKGNPWLKRALTEAGWAAGRCKHSYLGDRFRRFAARKGRKRAVVAVGHEILIIVYYLLTRGTEYQDLGSAYLDERHRAAVCKQAIKRLEFIGYYVQLKPRPEAA